MIEDVWRIDNAWRLNYQVATAYQMQPKLPSLNNSSTYKSNRVKLFKMAPITQASDESNHQALMDELDVQAINKPFRSANWRPAQRRNKNIKQIISEALRKEQSVLPTQDNSGSSTPLPANQTGQLGRAGVPNLAQATRNLSLLAAANSSKGVVTHAPMISYTNIESVPSLHPSSQRRYCDITGLSAPYTDPKSRLRYHNGEVFAVVRNLGQHATESYLAARGAHVVLK